jgi:single-strand DNA-binding protein
LGENCERYLGKGRKVAVVGPVSVSSYEAKDGSGTKFTLEVRADDVEFLSPKSEGTDVAEREYKPDPENSLRMDGDLDSDLPF